MEQHLRHLLDELQSAMGRTKDDDEDRQELATLHGAVAARLETGEEDPGLVDRFKAAEARFEADHPSLSSSLRQAMESLTAGGL